MSKFPPSFPWYPEAWIVSTMSMTLEEKGMYFDLLNIEWIEGQLPADPEEIRKIFKISPKKFQKTFKKVSKKFHIDEKNNSEMFNVKLEEIRAKSLEFSKKMSEYGKKGARVRLSRAKERLEAGLKHSVSDSVSDSNNNYPKGNGGAVPSDETDPLKVELKELSEKLYKEKIFPEVYAFVNSMIKNSKNIKSIIHTLNRCYKKKTFDKKGPYAYCVKIINIESGNYNEAEAIQEAQQKNVSASGFENITSRVGIDINSKAVQDSQEKLRRQAAEILKQEQKGGKK